MADKDLSYTNKDGLNPAAGFTNVFNYHKDGASEGEGYTTGGYPEVTGETSPLPSKNYKTGDDPDFFDNGNVWEQEQPEPGPGPTPPGGDFTATLKPAAITGTNGSLITISGEALSKVVTDGTFVDLSVGDTYTVVYKGVAYENQVVKSITIGGAYNFTGLGNLDSVLLRSDFGLALTDEQKAQMVDSDIPFALLQIANTPGVAAVFLDTNVNQTITATRTSDSSHYTLTFDSEVMGLYDMMVFIPPVTTESIIEQLNIQVNAKANTVINGVETTGIWTEMPNNSGTVLLLDGYTIETVQTQPVFAGLMTSSSGGVYTTTFVMMNITSPDTLITMTISPAVLPTPNYTFSLKPTVMTGGDHFTLTMVEASEAILSGGTFTDLVENAAYDVYYNNTVYENLIAQKVDLNDGEYSYLILGNVDSVLLRSDMVLGISEEERVQLTDSDIPFAIIQTAGSHAQPGYVGWVVFGTEDDINSVGVKTHGASDYSYWLNGNCSALSQSMIMWYSPPQTLTSFIEDLGAVNGAHSKVIMDGAEYEGTWVEEGGFVEFLIDDYSTPETSPIYAAIEDGVPNFGTYVTTDKKITATFVKER